MSTPKPEPNYDPFPPGRSYRTSVIECDAEGLDRMLKRGDFQVQGKDFSIYCDEPETIGGDNAYPPPLYYFAASLLF